MAAKKIIMQVSYPGLGDAPYKTVAFAPTLSVEEACRICALKGGLKDKIDEYGLCIKDSGTWLKSGDTLESYPLQNCSGLEYKPTPKKTTVTYEGEDKKMEIDFSLTGSEVLSLILETLGEPKSNEFGMTLLSESDGSKLPSVDYAKPLIDQANPSSTKISLKKKSKIGVIFRRGESKGKRESAFVTSNLSHSSSSVTKIFGVPLAQVAHPAKYGGLPAVVAKTIEYLEDTALKLEGIFRISGNQSEVLAMKKAFDEGQDVNVRECSSPHVAAGLLKLYLRDLPEPLFPYNLYEIFMALYNTVSNEGVRCTYYKVLVDTLPVPNQMLLFRILPFLANVVKYEEINKMAIHNVATVFGPNILRSSDKSAIAMIQGTAAVNAITCEIIQNYEELVEVCETDFVSVAVSLFPYTGKTESEVSFKEGEIVFVIKEDTAGWWEGEVNGNYGFFPSNYVKSVISIAQKEPEKPAEPVKKAEPKVEPKAEPAKPAVQKPAAQKPATQKAAAQKPAESRRGPSSGGSKQKFMSDLEELKKVANNEANNNAKLQTLVQSLVQEVENLKAAKSSTQSSGGASLGELEQTMVAMRSEIKELSDSNAKLLSELDVTNKTIGAAKKQLDALKTEEIALKRDFKILQLKCNKIPDGGGRRPAPTLN